MNVFINKSKALEKIIEGCLKNDRKAQKALFDRFSPKMLAICTRYISEKQAAEDVMITGFMKVFEKINQFRMQGSLEGWIRKLMINEALLYIRANKSVHLVSESNTSETYLVMEAHECSYDAEQLLEMVKQLPPGYRAVFNMYAIDGYSHKEIALELDITESTSKSQLHKARTLLQQRIVELENGRSIKTGHGKA